MKFELYPARALSYADLAHALAQGFEGYPVRIAPSAWEIEAKVVSDDLDLNASQVAAVAGEPVGIALLGVRDRRGWIGGLGVAREQRRNGIGKALMQAVIENARSLGLREITLEVLQSNEPAIDLYRHLSFETTSELLTWTRPLVAGPLPPPFERPEPVDLEEALACWDWHELSPHWQREPPSLRRRMARWGGEGRVRAIIGEQGIRAYALMAISQGNTPGEQEVRLLDVAVDPEAGIRGPGRALLQGLHNEFRNMVFSIYTFQPTMRSISCSPP